MSKSMELPEINACPCKATFTQTCDYVTHAIKNRERFSVACVALFSLHGHALISCIFH